MLSRLDAFKLDAFCTGKLVISFEAFFFFFFWGGDSHRGSAVLLNHSLIPFSSPCLWLLFMFFGAGNLQTGNHNNSDSKTASYNPCWRLQCSSRLQKVLNRPFLKQNTKTLADRIVWCFSRSTCQEEVLWMTSGVMTA